MLSARLFALLLAVLMWNGAAHGAKGLADVNPSGGITELSTGGQVPSESSFNLAKAVLPGYTIRRTVPEVRIQFTVADDQGRPLKSISSDDFRVLDNRLAVPRIRDFSRTEDLPLQVGILLDVSDSVERNAQHERQATQFFINHILRPQTDRAALMTFSRELRLWQRYTSERETLAQALVKVPQRGYITYLYDSVYQACLDQFSPAQGDESAQRILMLISDGEDTGSLHTMIDAITAAQRREVQIFALSFHSPRQLAAGDQILGQLAESTGGELYIAATEKDFPAIFAAMEQQVRTRYSFTFQPVDQTPGFHTLRIEMNSGRRLRVHARNGYFIDTL